MIEKFEADCDSGELRFLKEPQIDGYGILKYHGIYYKVIITYTNNNPTSLTVETLIPNTEEMIGIVLEDGNEVTTITDWESNIMYKFYKYNNKLYMISFDINLQQYTGINVFNEKEELAFTISFALDNGEATGYLHNEIIRYNNKLYILIESEDNLKILVWQQWFMKQTMRIII